MGTKQMTLLEKLQVTPTSSGQNFLKAEPLARSPGSVRTPGSPFPAAAPAGVAVPGRRGSQFPPWRIQAVGKAVAWLEMSGSSVGEALGVQQNETK